MPSLHRLQLPKLIRWHLSSFLQDKVLRQSFMRHPFQPVSVSISVVLMTAVFKTTVFKNMVFRITVFRIVFLQNCFLQHLGRIKLAV